MLLALTITLLIGFACGYLAGLFSCDDSSS